MSFIPPKDNRQQPKEHKKNFNKSTTLKTNVENPSPKFIEITRLLVQKIQQMDAKTEKLMIDYLADETIQEFCRLNQYFSFKTDSINELKTLFAQLIDRIRAFDAKENQQTLDELNRKHTKNLWDWLVRTNAFAEKLYSNGEVQIQPVVCSEYAPDLQLKILQIEMTNLQEPLLDIGCGKELNLVNYLRDKGIDAYGMDRFVIENQYYQQSDWLEYEYEPEKWGSIISNLGFSNHFIHHNLREDGNYREYAEKYMQILQSLKKGGSFYYAPDLSFIEMHLDKSKYRCFTFKIEGLAFKATRVTRI